jgi:predicted RND superfamily exporter protein
MVDVCAARPVLVLVAVLAALGGAWAYARQLELRSDFRELLPRDSPGYQAYEHQRGRLAGGASLIVVVESPDRAQNERFLDDLAAALPRIDAGRAAPLIARVESDVKPVRAFFSRNRWLYATEKELQEAQDELDLQFAVHTGFVEDLGADDAGAAGPPQPKKKLVEVLRDYKRRFTKGADPSADYPTGYFETADGGSAGLRIVSTSSGTGDAAGDALLAAVERAVAALGPARYHPRMVVGYGGDIPNAIEEKRSLESDALWATAGALVLILAGIALFFRSAAAIPIVALPALLGVGCAYSFATATFGYVNSSGAFLGAIIIGNGINYPIVLLARYRDFVARGMALEEARREAVVNAFRAELVGALVAAIAYGSLTVTRFRGFSQFGAIGFVGMLLVWISTLPLVPALVAALERIGVRVVPEPGRGTGWGRSPMGPLAAATLRGRWVVLALAAALTVLALWPLPAFLADPWEYNFSKLGSKETKQSGAGHWSNRADAIFGGKTNVASAAMLADSAAQVPLLKARILANDAADPEGKLIAEVLTLDDVLPGPAAVQRAKIGRLEHIRRRLARLRDVTEEERRLIEELTPPADLRPIGPQDLPASMLERFVEKDGRVGTVFYVKYGNHISLSDGRVLLRIARSTDRVELPDGTRVLTASRSTIFAEMLRSMRRDGPLATAVSFLAVLLVLLVATHTRTGALAVFGSLALGVVWMLGVAAWGGVKLNFLNFVALPITFGIGCEYPFNIYDRSRLLGGDVCGAVQRSGGAVALCSYTTIIGYGSLLLADNQALQSFGKLAIAGELGCVTAALVVLPALLHASRRARDTGASCAEPPDGRG